MLPARWPRFVSVAVSCLLLGSGPVLALSLPAGEGLGILRKECTRCHPLRKIVDAGGKTREDWEKHVIRMTDIERRPANLRSVVEYLTTHFPPEGRTP